MKPRRAKCGSKLPPLDERAESHRRDRLAAQLAQEDPGGDIEMARVEPQPQGAQQQRSTEDSASRSGPPSRREQAAQTDANRGVADLDTSWGGPRQYMLLFVAVALSFLAGHLRGAGVLQVWPFSTEVPAKIAQDSVLATGAMQIGALPANEVAQTAKESPTETDRK